MSIVKSLSVGNGDMYYIRHASDNFTIVDCCLSDENKERIVKEIQSARAGKEIARFISTHPDEDHIQGLKYLDQQLGIVNFYCVKNAATKLDETESFKHYCTLRDGEHAFHIHQGCKRQWMNQESDERGSAGLHVLWPRVSNTHYQDALKDAAAGVAFNNISAMVQFNSASNIRMLWLGDLETAFMEAIKDDVTLEKTHIVFAPHHGRKSGKIPNSWLDKLQPEIIVLGEAPSRHMHYYSGYCTLTQNRAGDITFDLSDKNRAHIYCSEKGYDPGIKSLVDEKQAKYSFYKGTLVI